MKKIKYIIFSLLVLLIVPFTVNAASGTIRVSGPGYTVVQGNTVTYTVTLSSSVAIGSWDMLLSYDTSMLQLISSTGEAGGTRMVNSSSGTKSKSYTFKFKTLKTGTTTVSVNSYQVFAYSDLSKMSISSTGGSITVKTQQQIIDSYSKDNNLKSLTVDGYELNEEFNKDTLEYTLDVPEGTKEIKINAGVNDYRASVEGAGTLEVTPGINNFEILVRAQSGAEKTYKLTVNVIDQNPIDIETDTGNKTVVKLAEQLEMPNGFTESTITMGEFEIPTFYNEKLDYTLVGLKDLEGNVNLYIYDETNNSYELYVEFKFMGLTIVPITADKELENYRKFTEKIFDTETDVYKVSSKSSHWIFYGKNIMTGEEGYYIYDSKNESVVTYDSEYIDDLLETQKLYTYIIMGLAGTFLIMFIIIITLLAKNSKRRKQLKTMLNNKSEVKEVSVEKKEELTQKTKTIKIPEKEVKEEFENILETKKEKKKKEKPKKERSTRD